MTVAALGRPAPPGLLAWWLSELRELLPRRLRRRGAPARCILVAPRQQWFEVVRRRGARLEPLGELPAGEDGATRAGVAEAALQRQLASGKEPVWLMLPAADGFVAHDTLPSVAERDLMKIMRHRIELLTPWPATSVHADARLVRRRADGSVDVDLAVGAKEAIDPALAALVRLGLRPEGVELADPADGGPAGFDLLGGGARRRRGRWLWTAAIIAGAVVLALGGWAGVTIAGLEGQLDQRRRHAGALAVRFADLPALSEQIERQREQARFVADRRLESVSATVVVEVLSRLLPDGVWLTELGLEGRELAIGGFAGDAAPILAMIEASPHFTEARFRAPITRTVIDRPDGSSTTAERFAIAARVTPLMDPGR